MLYKHLETINIHLACKIQSNTTNNKLYYKLGKETLKKPVYWLCLLPPSKSKGYVNDIYSLWT